MCIIVFINHTKSKDKLMFRVENTEGEEEGRKIEYKESQIAM